MCPRQELNQGPTDPLSTALSITPRGRPIKNDKKIKNMCLRQGLNQGPTDPLSTALFITPRGMRIKIDEKIECV